ncbi:MAG: hypothetical protein ACOC1O_00030 [bacterium]
MSYSKEIIEEALYEVLNECLKSNNQEGSILELKYDEVSNTCNITLSVCIVEEDNYIAFQVY